MDREERLFSAKDVREAAGLTYRQISDWDSRDALPHARTSESGWRHFTPRELFVLMICAELRRRFGVPVKRLQPLRKLMEEPQVNHLVDAVTLMTLYGDSVWFATDLDTRVIIDTRQSMARRMTEEPASDALIAIGIDKMVNKLLAIIDGVDPFNKSTRGKMTETPNPTERALTREEAFVLHSMRDPCFSRIEVALSDGSVETVKRSTSRDPTIEIERLLREHAYQRLTVLQKDGRIVSVEQQSSHKPSI